MSASDHRRELLDRLDAIKPEKVSDESGEIDIAEACAQAIREYLDDEPEWAEEYLIDAPAELLRVWNNQANQSKRARAKSRYGDDVNKAIRGEDVSAPTLNGQPNREILELEFGIHSEKGRLVQKQLGYMTGPQRRELEGRYGKEEQSKRRYRRFFNDLNRLSDEERERKGLNDQATLFEIWGQAG